MTYQIEFTKAARRDLRSLSRDIVKRVDTRVLRLAEEPRPPGVEKLSGEERMYRIRVGQYRVLYRIEDAVLLILVVRVRHRREVYRRLG